MLVLPVDENAWGFRACLYVGMALLVLDVVLPRVFRRRVRLMMPPRPRRLQLPRAHPMADDRFRRKKRDLQAQIRALQKGEELREDSVASQSDTGVESEVEARRARRQLAEKTKKKQRKQQRNASRVVMHGETRANEGEEEEEDDDVSALLRRRPKKRVSFDMSRNEFDESRKAAEETTAAAPSRRERSKATSTTETDPSGGSVANAASGSKAIQEERSSLAAPTANTRDAPQAKPSSRPDPFSLVDDDFPWQLPNYARAAPRPAPHAPASTAQPASQFQPGSLQGFTLNVRRPVGNSNASASAASSVSLLGLTNALELKHKPLWKRGTRESSPARQGPPQAVDATRGGISSGSSFSSSFTSAQSTAPSRQVQPPATKPQELRLLFRPDESLRPSPSAKRTHDNPFLAERWLAASSPKPPLHPRQTAVPLQTSNEVLMSTPVAAQPRLRTPKIIRRITFDEDMMGALATPSDASPLITESTRKRQRENDVLEALDAVGLPWHKRRFNS